MPTEPIQQILAAFEITLLLIGVWLVGRFALNAPFRARWWSTNQLPPWSVALAEFALYLFVLFSGSFIMQGTLGVLLGKIIAKAPDRLGLEMIVYTGAGLDGGAILGWLLFPFLRRAWLADYGATPDPEPPVKPRLPWTKVLLYAGAVVAVALPVLSVVSLGWTFALKQAGLPDDLQESIAIFSNTKSPWVVAGMLLSACVLAPLMEELLFRAGIYRYCRQHLGRSPALLISGVIFGAIHLNWAGFIPLAVLGMMLALVYEATGSIRVAILAHAFFNLNNIVAILSGLTT